MTYSELLDLVPRVGTVLRDHGVGPGGRVMLLAFNSAEWIVGFWATLAAGAVVVLANAWWSEAELAHALGVVDVTWCWPIPGRPGSYRPECRSSSSRRWWRGPRAARRWRRRPRPWRTSRPLILFTSGTSGPPKGAVLPHRSVIALQHMLLHVTRQLPHTLGGDFPREVSLQTGPLFHVGGVQALVRQLLVGGTLVFPTGRFDPAEVLDLIESEGVHRWGGVPTMVNRVLSEPSIGRRDLTTVRSISLGGSPVPPELVTRIKTRFPTWSGECRRSTACPRGAVPSPPPPAATSSNGPAPPAGRCPWSSCASTGPTRRERARGRGPHADPDARLLGPGLRRRASMMKAGSTPATSAISTRDGYLFITGRMKDLIIRGGENVAAPHVENVLLRHPEIRDVAVCGRPDPDLGEIVAAAVVLDPSSTVTVAELRAFAAEHLAYFEIPTSWWLRTDPLPSNDVGKVQKRQLLATWPGA